MDRTAGAVLCFSVDMPDESHIFEDAVDRGVSGTAADGFGSVSADPGAGPGGVGEQSAKTRVPGGCLCSPRPSDTGRHCRKSDSPYCFRACVLPSSGKDTGTHKPFHAFWKRAVLDGPPADSGAAGTVAAALEHDGFHPVLSWRGSLHRRS